jgi:anionic cell wall polymer biosynthesis LytR-Cps2A-Psr (LCP) family protein
LSFGLGVLAILVGLFYWQLQASLASFEVYSDLTASQLFALYRSSQAETLAQTDGRVNVLLLGIDTLTYRNADTPLTDTIMLASYDLAGNQITLLPLPRDLYLTDFSQKINSIYGTFYRLEPDQAREQTRVVIENLIDLPVHYCLVVSLAEVKDFLTLIDGISLEVQTAFTDPLYPRDEVDIQVVADPKLLYETVSFASGWQDFDPDLAIKFIRSRHASGVEGNDYARSVRQQQVLIAVGQKVGQILLMQLRHYDFTFLGQLYQFYLEHYQEQLPFTKLLAFGHQLTANGHLPEVHQAQLAVAPGAAGAYLREEDKTEFRILITDLIGLQTEIKAKLEMI